MKPSTAFGAIAFATLILILLIGAKKPSIQDKKTDHVFQENLISNREIESKEDQSEDKKVKYRQRSRRPFYPWTYPRR